ncbi:MAG: multifunctional CCA addition/repair protein [Lysobacterales bacterium]
MNVFLVGGAVRDEMLGLPVVDRDFVVTGATPEMMAAQGYRPVGKDFPVFLHPDSHEEYALARRERKVAAGYKGFSFHAGPEVTLEEDLARRDLTINAMAKGQDGELVDPYGGAADIQSRTLRHVTEAFAEDPVRVLRLARFAARLAVNDFTVAPDTVGLARKLAAAGELDALVAERVWTETDKALMTQRPDRFVEVLRDCHALAAIFPEVDALFGVPQTASYHPEVDTGVHLLMVLRQSASMGLTSAGRFACLTHDLGKALTPDDVLPSHRGHEEAGLKPLAALCDRLRMPKEHRRLAELVCRYHLHVHRALELKASTVMKVIKAADAMRRPDRFEQFLLACEADARGRGGEFANQDYPQPNFLRAAFQAVVAVPNAPLRERGLEGLKLAEALNQERVAAIAATRSAWPSTSPD